jgi:predicted DCC family thiol-disulfide oxidoreductase YuxK
MISLASELTDGKGRHARGWLFFDAECRFCTRFVRWLVRSLYSSNLAVAPLQDPRVAALLGASPEELLRAIRYVDSVGRQYLGADALLAVAGEIWWARPLAWAARFPAFRRGMSCGYNWLAARRHCAGYRQVDDTLNCATTASASRSCL